MKIQIIILVLISNVAFGQRSEVVIDTKIVEYEKLDDYQRFDDVETYLTIDYLRKKEFKIISESDSEIELYNIYNSGFGGEEISIKLNNKLEIIGVDFNQWSDVIDVNNPIKEKVSKIELKLNQNPFLKIKNLRGEYLLEVQHIDKEGEIIRTEFYKGKFKSYKHIPKDSAEHKWAVEQSLIFKGITDRNGYFLNPDKKAALKSSEKELVNEIKKLNEEIPYKIKTLVVVNEFGKIEKVLEVNTPMDFDLKLKIVNTIRDMTDWYPACLNDVPVKTKIPLVIGIE
jgi:hypothetical protein